MIIREKYQWRDHREKLQGKSKRIKLRGTLIIGICTSNGDIIGREMKKEIIRLSATL